MIGIGLGLGLGLGIGLGIGLMLGIGLGIGLGFGLWIGLGIGLGFRLGLGLGIGLTLGPGFLTGQCWPLTGCILHFGWLSPTSSHVSLPLFPSQPSPTRWTLNSQHQEYGPEIVK